MLASVRATFVYQKQKSPRVAIVAVSPPDAVSSATDRSFEERARFVCERRLADANQQL